VALQSIGIFGIFFVLGFVLSKLTGWTQKNYYQTVGWKGILWTAWLGTPIHELSHLIFALIFLHRIDSVSIFKPNRETNQLGQVSHSYRRDSLYQNIGNFFIGAGPMILGSIVLVTLMYFLVPNGPEIYAFLMAKEVALDNLFKSAGGTIIMLFDKQNLDTINFWLFLYVSFCIASHMAPSLPDLKRMFFGLGLIIFILLLVNYFALILKIDFTGYILSWSNNLNILVAIFIYSIVIAFTHFVLSGIILWPIKNLLKK
jgi:hypothetical protein